MVKVGLVGLGKMGISHFAIINSNPDAKVDVCDASGLVVDTIGRYTSTRTWRNYDEMLKKGGLDAVIIATPSKLHAPMVRTALEHGLHVFCEKPFCLDWRESEELAALANRKGLVNQVGYHYRYVGAFREMKRLVDAQAIGEITHVLAEAYGPVVLKPKGTTWRTDRQAGGGCLYDYAAHPINLINWYFGLPDQVTGTILNSIFSSDTDDEVYSTFAYAGGRSVHLSVNWSDESYRKMSTKITLVGTKGRITADRQELQAYLREPVAALPDYHEGWNVKYTTELTETVRFYLRGEEYSAQLDDFVNLVQGRRTDVINDFWSAAVTDRTIALMIDDAEREKTNAPEIVRQAPARKRWFGLAR
ncbi:MAG: Gfo/Idh/MocA family oxidoreductase [Rhizobiaceae bacterium]|nr:Gfo/Idh/MocA family oxidoreductase [Rhizobiaceae bacterium]